MVSVNNIVVSFGGVPLYEEVSFLINPKDRIGLAGKNGAGKSTLLKILAGHQKPDSGEIGKPNQCTIGYLPQEMNHHSGKTVFEETATAFIELKQIEKRIEEITVEISTREDYESDAYMKLLTELNDVNERLTLLGGHAIEGQIEQTLIGLGFTRTDFEKKMTEFSGGWRMRVELAKILLQKPNLLLLDEPTNHLDIESIQWLEDFLKNYPGAIVMVSHDKAFLDNITTRTIEISLGKIFDYKANYSKYLQLRKERKEQQLAEAKNQQKYIEKTTDLINKYKAKASKASFAQSLIKKLDKMDVIEVDDEDTSSIRFNFPPVTRSGRVIYEVKNIKKSFGPKLILSGIDFSVERGEKIAFVGKNGEGKSTMLKMLVGDEKYEGEIKLGHNAHVGYYAQNQLLTL